MYLELAWECHYTDDLRAGCSHYVHFLVCKPCSRSFLRFLRRGDQWIIGPAIGLGIPMNASIPRGNRVNGLIVVFMVGFLVDGTRESRGLYGGGSIIRVGR